MTIVTPVDSTLKRRLVHTRGHGSLGERAQPTYRAVRGSRGRRSGDSCLDADSAA